MDLDEFGLILAGIENENRIFTHLLGSGALHPNLVELVGCFDGDGREAEDLGLEVAHSQATALRMLLKCF